MRPKPMGSALGLALLTLLATSELPALPGPGLGVPASRRIASTAHFGGEAVTVELDEATSIPRAIFPESPVAVVRPVRTAMEAEAAAVEIIDAHTELFRMSSLDLAAPRAFEFLGTGWIINCQQIVRGIPVRGSYFHMWLTKAGELVHCEARLFPSSELARTNTTPAITADQAITTAVNAQPRAHSVSNPKLEIVFPSDTPILAWRVEIGSEELPAEIRDTSAVWSYTVSAATSDILAAEEAFSSIDLQGDVKARGTNPASLLPDEAYNPPVTTPFPLAKLRVELKTGGTFAIAATTNSAGAFTIPNMPDGVPLEVRARCISAPFNIFTSFPNGSNVVDTITNYATYFFALRLNASPAEFNTSQINAYTWIRKARDYADYLNTAGGFAVPQRHLSVSVNSSFFQCNANYFPTGPSIVFPKAAAGCVNMAYSTVITHEFGHHFTRENQIALNDQLPWGSAGQTTKEAAADIFMAYLSQQPVNGQDWQGPGTFMRDLSQLQVFPNGSNAHEVGRALGGSFWSLRAALQAQDGSAGVIVAESFYIFYIKEHFFDIGAIPDIDEGAGEALLRIDAQHYGGFYKSFIMNAFLPHNLYRHRFIRGDVNGDNQVDISDFVLLGQYVSNGAPVPGCLDAADVNDDGLVNGSDSAALSSYLFSGGGPPSPPFPICGRDPASTYPNMLDFQTCLQGPCPD